MATIALSVIGGALAGPLGPLGAAVGSLAGSWIDRAWLSGGKDREGPRLDDLSVQSADYGAPLARHYGTVRSSGPVIWSSELRETAHTTGGGKRSGGRTTSYSYSASFAVVISGRPIDGVGRIWADGKLLRGRLATCARRERCASIGAASGSRPIRCWKRRWGWRRRLRIVG